MTNSLFESLPPPARAFLAAFLQRKRPILAFVLAVMVLSVVVALLLPPWYRAQSTVLPPTEGNDAFGTMTSLVQSAALSHIGLATSSTASDIFEEILKSRTLQEDLVRTFRLDSLYGLKGMDRTLKELGQHVKVATGVSGLLIVQVEDREPARAAEMANRLVDELDRFNREALNTRAKRMRQFLEVRVADARSRMRAADSTLESYERRHGVVTDGATIGGMAGIIAQKLNLQVKR
mgnify:CR=1 FL=1